MQSVPNVSSGYVYQYFIFVNKRSKLKLIKTFPLNQSILNQIHMGGSRIHDHIHPNVSIYKSQSKAWLSSSIWVIDIDHLIILVHHEPLPTNPTLEHPVVAILLIKPWFTSYIPGISCGDHPIAFEQGVLLYNV